MAGVPWYDNIRVVSPAYFEFWCRSPLRMLSFSKCIEEKVVQPLQVCASLDIPYSSLPHRHVMTWHSYTRV